MNKKFLKSKIFPVIIFLIFEVLLFVVGYLQQWQAMCVECPSNDENCPPCPSGHYGFIYIAFGTIPSLAASYLIWRKFRK